MRGHRTTPQTRACDPLRLSNLGSQDPGFTPQCTKRMTDCLRVPQSVTGGVAYHYRVYGVINKRGNPYTLALLTVFVKCNSSYSISQTERQ